MAVRKANPAVRCGHLVTIYSLRFDMNRRLFFVDIFCFPTVFGVVRGFAVDDRGDKPHGSRGMNATDRLGLATPLAIGCFRHGFCDVLRHDFRN